MPWGSIDKLLDKIKERGEEHASQTSLNIDIDRDDLVRLKALSELYGLPVSELSSVLMAEILGQVEAKIPYVAGDKVIREEDGEPIYEDVGDTPKYLELKRRIEAELN